MFDIGTQELIIIFVVALLVFGPKRLPELARTLGKGVRELKSAMQGLKDNIENVEEDISSDVKKAKEHIFTGNLFDFPNDLGEQRDTRKTSANERDGGTGGGTSEESRNGK